MLNISKGPILIFRDLRLAQLTLENSQLLSLEC